MLRVNFKDNCCKNLWIVTDKYIFLIYAGRLICAYNNYHEFEIIFKMLDQLILYSFFKRKKHEEYTIMHFKGK